MLLFFIVSWGIEKQFKTLTMDLKDSLKSLSERISKLKESILTEEATKNAFIMPFIQSLGYDVFNPLEVVPEMDCDLIKNKGDKIDYAIMKDDEPVILIECKHWKQNLNLHDNQLQKYFVASKARFGVLTNGIIYRFYTDLVKANIMDDTPFLEVNMEELKENQIEELKKFHKSYFDINNILSTASELKYLSELKTLIKAEFSNPSADFVRYFARQIYNGQVKQGVLDMFTDLLKRTISNHINDVITKRLNVATEMTNDVPQEQQEAEQQNQNVEEETPRIVTTEEELEGYYIVKYIIRNIIPSERIFYRDTQSYFTIIADNSNRKLICRLYLNTSNKKIGMWLGEDRHDEVFKIESLDDIYNYSEQLIYVASRYF